MLYLFAIPKSRPDLVGDLVGEVHYKHGDVTLTPAELTPARLNELVSLIKVIGADVPPPKKPSREECKRCNIGSADCPERVLERRPTAVGEF
jgi:hypothetical protein